MKPTAKIIFASILIICQVPTLLYGQDTSKIEARIELNYFQVNKELPYLTSRVRTKTPKGWIPVKWVIVNLFLNEETKLGMMGNITTDAKGEGKYILPTKFKGAWDTLDQFNFTARILGDAHVADARKTIAIVKSTLELETLEVDKVRTIRMRFTARQDKKWAEVPGVEMKPFINRTFGRLPAGDGLTTDESGAADLTFSDLLPGNEDGVITVGVFIEDHEDYGNVTTMKEVTWGVPLVKDVNFFKKRTLWTSRERAPVWLLIFPNLMILLVWGVIGYLVYQIGLLYKIYRNSLINKQ